MDRVGEQPPSVEPPAPGGDLEFGLRQRSTGAAASSRLLSVAEAPGSEVPSSAAWQADGGGGAGEGGGPPIWPRVRWLALLARTAPAPRGACASGQPCGGSSGAGASALRGDHGGARGRARTGRGARRAHDERDTPQPHRRARRCAGVCSRVSVATARDVTSRPGQSPGASRPGPPDAAARTPARPPPRGSVVIRAPGPDAAAAAPRPLPGGPDRSDGDGVRRGRPLAAWGRHRGRLCRRGRPPPAGPGPRARDRARRPRAHAWRPQPPAAGAAAAARFP